MPKLPTHHIQPVDELAAQFKEFHKRINSLERASTSGFTTGDIDARVIAVGDPRYVNVTGDAMTGQLQINGGGNSLAFGADASYLAFFTAGFALRRGYLQGHSSGLSLIADIGVVTIASPGGHNFSGGRVDFGSQAIQSVTTFNGYALSTASGAGSSIACRDANAYLGATYFYTTANVAGGYPVYLAGGSGDNYIRWYNKSGQFSASSLATQLGGISGVWTNAQIIINAGNSWAMQSFHCGGVAPTFFTANGNGNVFFHRDTNGGVGSSCLATAYGIESSRKIKRNINPYPLKAAGAAVERATDLVARLEPSTFQININSPDVPSGRRLEAYLRLNKYKADRGLPPYELPVHDCAIHDCVGSPDKPCPIGYEADKMRYGFIAEDMNDQVPECILIDADLQPMGIDYAMLTTIALAAIQELTERIRVLEGEPA